MVITFFYRYRTVDVSLVNLSGLVALFLDQEMYSYRTVDVSLGNFIQ